MASSGFPVRCKSNKGQYIIEGLRNSTSLMTLKEAILKATDIQPKKQKILIGFPPKPIKVGNDNLKLSDVGIESFETLIVEEDSNLDAQVVPEVDLPSSSQTSKKRKQDEMEEHDSEATSPGIMMRHDVPSDNSCLFSSVYFIMNDGSLDLSKSDGLRQVIAEAVLRDPNKYTAAILGRENRDYYYWILNRLNWGGAIELAILSEHYNVEICAIDVMSCKMLRFGEDNNYRRRGIVLYDGIHYDPLYMQREDKMETLFDIRDTLVLDHALELAREARSSKQFTDVVNFKLRCEDCDTNLVGEKDAALHANATGHINFGEFR